MDGKKSKTNTTKKTKDESWEFGDEDFDDYSPEQEDEFGTGLTTFIMNDDINASARRSVEILREQLELQRALQDGFDFN